MLFSVSILLQILWISGICTLMLYYISTMAKQILLQLNDLKQHLWSIVSVCQESGHSLTGCSGSEPLPGYNPSVGNNCCHLSAWQGKDLLPSSLQWSVVGSSLFLASGWTEGLSCSLAVGWWSPSIPCHLGLSLGQLTTWQIALSKQESEKELQGKQKSQSFIT